MKIEYVMIIWALLLNIYVFIWFFNELFFLLKDYCNKKYIYWDKNHSIEHIEYISIYILFIIIFYIWLLWHWWIEHSIQVHLIDEYAFIVLYIMWLSNNTLLKHIKKERLNS